MIKIVQTFILCFSFASANLDTEWWKHTTVYELLPQSFKDSDGDGIGDIPGLISKLDHFCELGIETLYLTPCFKTGFKDMGYDIIDYYEIDPRYGTMEDFDQLIKEIKARGMKLMLDLVINHSSNEHEWFIKSVQRIDPYTDYYVWKDPVYTEESKDPNPPNDWGFVFGNGWTYDKKRKQYYYHAFLPEQPDLNLRNEHLKNELKNMMAYWLDKGVAGFRTDAPMCYIEDKLLRDDSYNRQLHTQETFDLLHEFRMFFDDYNKKHGGIERILIPEPHADPELAQAYIGTKDYPVNHAIFNYYFEYARSPMKAFEIDYIIQSWIGALPPNTIGWVTQDHDQARTGSRINENYMDILTTITSLLPGILHLYYGQEIGLMNGVVKPSQIKDFSGGGGRDPNRLIMQWDDSISAGFSSNRTTFSPINADYPERNVKNQKKQENSHYNLLKSLLDLRKTKTIKYGDFHSHVYSPDIYIFWRTYKKHPTIVVIINLDFQSSKIDLKRIFNPPSKTYTIAAASINSGFSKWDTIEYRNKHEIVMTPQSAIVFSTIPDKQYFQKKAK